MWQYGSPSDGSLLLCSVVFEAYMKLSGYEIEESIKRETSRHLETVLLAVGECVCV